MKLAYAAACLAATLSLATNALAEGRTVATLQQPIAKKTQFIAKGAIWDCEDTACVADHTPDQTFGPDQCHKVAKAAGVAVADFKTDYVSLKPAALDQCNAGLTPKSPVTASR
jgi:hypothetical protein